MAEVINPGYRERIEKYLEGQQFMLHNHMRVVSIRPGEVVSELDIEAIHEQQFGRVHGGVISTLADISAGFAAYTMVDENTHVVTGEIKISYLRAARGSKLISKGKVLKSGKKLSFCEAEVWSVDGGSEVLVAKASTSMIHIPVVQG